MLPSPSLHLHSKPKVPVLILFIFNITRFCVRVHSCTASIFTLLLQNLFFQRQGLRQVTHWSLEPEGSDTWEIVHKVSWFWPRLHARFQYRWLDFMIMRFHKRFRDFTWDFSTDFAISLKMSCKSSGFHGKCHLHYNCLNTNKNNIKMCDNTVEIITTYK